MSSVIYTYGTLRPGNTEKVLIPGELYDLGWFPGVKLGGRSLVACERVVVDDIEAVDRYEGYNPAYPDESLYIRRPYLDGFIYEFNGPVNPIKLIQSGDWLAYRREARGKNAGYF